MNNIQNNKNKLVYIERCNETMNNKKRIKKEDAIFNSFMTNLVAIPVVIFIGKLLEIFVFFITFIISIPFDSQNNWKIVYNLDSFAYNFGDAIFNTAIFISVILAIRSVFFYNSYRKIANKKAC